MIKINGKEKRKRIGLGGCYEFLKNVCCVGRGGFGGREGGIWGCRERLEKRLREIEISM